MSRVKLKKPQRRHSLPPYDTDYLLIIHPIDDTYACETCRDARKQGRHKLGYGLWLHRQLRRYRKRSQKQRPSEWENTVREVRIGSQGEKTWAEKDHYGHGCCDSLASWRHKKNCPRVTKEIV